MFGTCLAHGISVLLQDKFVCRKEQSPDAKSKKPIKDEEKSESEEVEQKPKAKRKVQSRDSHCEGTDTEEDEHSKDKKRVKIEPESDHETDEEEEEETKGKPDPTCPHCQKKFANARGLEYHIGTIDSKCDIGPSCADFLIQIASLTCYLY